MGFANVRAGTQVEYPFVLLGGLTCLDWHAAGACVCSSELLLARSSVSNSEKWNIIISNCDYGGHIIISNVGIINDIKRYIIVAAKSGSVDVQRAPTLRTGPWTRGLSMYPAGHPGTKPCGSHRAIAAHVTLHM